MFGIDSAEFLVIAVVALVVIGPKDLPRVMRLIGGWVGKGRAMSRHLRSGFDTMMREAELEEMQKQWAKQNADIMAATNVHVPYEPATAPAEPVPEPAAQSMMPPVPVTVDDGTGKMSASAPAVVTGHAVTQP
jgi:sec-independent protein translocase protein TatB